MAMGDDERKNILVLRPLARNALNISCLRRKKKIDDKALEDQKEKLTGQQRSIAPSPSFTTFLVRVAGEA